MDRVERDTADRTFALGLGVDQRGLKQGSGQNDRSANIGAVDPRLIVNDARYYTGMPMSSPSSDPIRAQSGNKALQDLIRRNLAIGAAVAPPAVDVPAVDVPAVSPTVAPRIKAVAPASEPVEAPESAEPANDDSIGQDIPATPKAMWAMVMTFPRRCTEVARGTYTDLSQWNRLPCRTTAERTKYVLQRDNRIYFLLALLILIVVIAAGVRGLANLGKPAGV